jgi:hypothetical protein
MSLLLSGTDGLSDVDGTAATPAIRGTDANTGIFFPAADTIAFSEGGVEAMRIDSVGNVGIGTASPTSGGKLDVNGIAYFGTADKVKIYSNNVLQNAGTLDVGTIGNASLNLITNNSTKATIDTSGNLLVGTTSGASNSRITVKGDNTISLVGGTSTNSGDILFHRVDTGAKVWGIQTNATAFYISDSDFSNYAYLNQNFTGWSFASDSRLKTDIVDLEYGLAAVLEMQPRRYRFIASEKMEIGFIAQELKSVIPEAVSGVEQEFVDTDTPQERASKTLGVGKEILIPVLVKAIQEQQAIITQQQATIAAMETRLAALEA